MISSPIVLGSFSVIQPTLLLNNSDTIAKINGYVEEDALKSFLETNVKVGE